MRIFSVLLLCVIPFLPVTASAADGCPAGSFAAITSPDGTTLTILFDSFAVSSTSLRATCTLNVPLSLPEGYSLGVYRVDYRGFAHLSRKEIVQLTVDYHLGPRGKSRRFNRKVSGVEDGEFMFTENIGAGLMKRVGCGDEAALNISLSLALEASAGTEAMATMDSSDGAPKGGVIYYLDTKRCGK